MFAQVCRRRGLKFNAAKSKVMVLNEGEGLECEVHVDGIRWGVLRTNRAECSRKVASGRRVTGG